jgi:hypothetical protein
MMEDDPLADLIFESAFRFDPVTVTGAVAEAVVADRTTREEKRRRVYRLAGSMRAAMSTATTRTIRDSSIFRLDVY